MAKTSVIHTYESLGELAAKLRDDLTKQDYVIMYAYNGTGKTRISGEFKNIGKAGGIEKRDTLYFNAFTEDLFTWDNDLENDTERLLKINSNSNFFNGFKELALEEKIFNYLQRYAEFDYKIDYEKWTISFSKRSKNPNYKSQKDNTEASKLETDQTEISNTEADKLETDNTEIGAPQTNEPEYITYNNIKISRGEETIFRWCIFLALCELAIDGSEAYNWVNFFFIDDPISSLDDNNAIAVATDLSRLLIKGNGKIKTVISTHHVLFFNVLFNELKNKKSDRYFLYKHNTDSYSLRKTNDTPYFHHVANLSELKQVMESGDIKTFHFNMLRSILEKTASFFGFDRFGKCIHGVEDEILFERALNLLSHGKYSVYEPEDMNQDNKDLFKKIMTGFLEKYKFELPVLLIEEAASTTHETEVPAAEQISPAEETKSVEDSKEANV